ncbi:hypothetical protein NRIC_31580 [Enterococcus florum]|uniref:DUF2877 domain-containing protein n=1 Tax=Enterococcus florum TaxID=2480627 RepID=A0A4P5PAX9_9ENTE|nr:DUF2877 domain-containing protein [Enterococcus florum]GCF95267.1 hypothetical protein NRIC_31580 [Enterococcus florum]
MWNKPMISPYLVPLDQYGKIGKVHSDFEHSFNIAVGKQLINVGNYHNYLSSFGFFLPDPLFQELHPFAKVGNVVKIKQDQLTFYDQKGVYKLSLSNMELRILKTNPLPVDKAYLKQLVELLESEALASKIGLVIDAKAEKYLQQLVNDERPDWTEIKKYLIGRGKGLTPSGDDLLVAYLFIMNLFWQERAQELALVLDQELSTTAVSQNYLWACQKGYVSSPIYQLYSAIQAQADRQTLQAAVKQVLRIGHTSGKDMGFGLLLGLKAIIK